MLRRALFFAVCLGAALFGSGPARGADSPMMTAYRAYTAALKSGDLNEAERQAALALDAAEASASNKRGILAINLANVRMDLGKRSEAIGPANRAAELLKEGNSGLAPELVDLVLARSQLDSSQGKTVDRAIKAVKKAQEAQIDSALINDSAVDLGLMLIKLRRHQDALEVWEIARATAAGDLEKLPALLYGGVSLVYLDEAKKGIALFDEALKLVVPLLPRERTAWTPADYVSSKLRAWRSTAISTLPIDERKGFSSFELPGFPGVGSELCPLRIIAKPFPRYPRSQSDKGSFASLVMGYDVAEDGALSNVVILASAPEIEDFSQAILKVAPSWRFEKKEDAPAGCKLARAKSDVLFSFRIAE